MNGFTYSSPTQIHFGKDTIAQVGEQMKPYAKKVLLHYGGGSIKRNGVYDTVVASLAAAGLEVVELGGVVPNPRFTLVEEGIELCRKEGIEGIVAVGGGSVIDSAKAIAGGIFFEGDYWEVGFMKHTRPTKALPIGVVLTIPAAGSETNTGMVITNEKTGFKRSLGATCLIPKFAIIDPTCHFTLPAYQTACGCADIFAHLLERYFTNTEHVDYSDRLLEASMQTIIHYAPLAIEHPDDYDIRAEIAWCGTIAHNGLLGKGREEDWATHQLQHELGAKYDITHGEGLAVIFPAWMRYVWKHDPARFVQYATRIWHIDYAAHETEKTVLEAIDRTEQFMRRMGLKTRLHELNIPEEDFEYLADKMLADRPSVGKFVPIRKEEALAIYRLAI